MKKGNTKTKKIKLSKKPTITNASSHKNLLANIKLPLLKKINPIRHITQWREDKINGKLKLAFEHLHHEFNQREQQLEHRIQEIKNEHEALLLQRQKKLFWMIPLGLAVAIGGSYMLFVLTNMQNSMSQMTESMTGMNTYIASMSSDMNNMNNSMSSMNNNVEGMTTAITPMGEAAQETTPFIRAFRSFMPF